MFFFSGVTKHKLLMYGNSELWFINLDLSGIDFDLLMASYLEEESFVPPLEKIT